MAEPLWRTLVWEGYTSIGQRGNSSWAFPVNEPGAKDKQDWMIIYFSSP
jgi:hypothetical protein